MSELYFDTEIYKKDTSVYSSLEELNGYKVFSDAFYDRMLAVKKREKTELDEDYRIVFTNEAKDLLNESYMFVMNSEQPLVIRNNQEQEINTNTYSSIIYVAVGMIITTAFLLLAAMMKDMRKKDNENNNHNKNIRNSKDL